MRAREAERTVRVWKQHVVLSHAQQLVDRKVAEQAQVGAHKESKGGWPRGTGFGAAHQRQATPLRLQSAQMIAH